MARKWWTLMVTSVAIFMLLLDITIVNVALPAIQRDLGASFADLEWVVSAYALTLAATLLVCGSLADHYGRRLVFVAGLVLFVVASLACGLAGSPLVLNLARGVQGIGGAAMFSTYLALIANAFHGPDRGTAFGVLGAVTGGAVAIGPLVGGALTDAVGWEAIFLVNVPIGIAAVPLALTRVDESRDPRGARVDVAGAVTFSAALFLLIFGLVRGNAEGWSSTQILGALIGAAVLLVAFVIVETRSDHAMFDLRLFRKPAFTGASITAFTLSAGMFSMFLFITLYLQNVLGYGPLEAGLRSLPITLLSFAVGPVAGKLTTRLPARLFFGVGLALVGAGLLLMSGVQASDDWTTLLAGFVVAGAGIGIVNPPLASASIAVVEPERSGMAGGINSTFRQIGISTGIAGLGALFQSRVADELGERLAGTPGAQFADRIAEAVVSGGGGAAIQAVPASSREVVGEASRQAFISGLNTLFVVAAVVALVGAVLSAALVRQRDFVTAPTGAPVGL